jgi:hypothetical protein
MISGEVALTPASGVRFLLTLTLVEVGWGTVWNALATTNWALPLQRWRNWHVGDASPVLPYVQPGSPGDRLTDWFSQLRFWYRAVLAPTVGQALGAAVAGVILSLLLALLIGMPLFLLTLAAFALIELAVALHGGRGQPATAWDGLLKVGLAWLAGHLAFAPVTLPSLILALAFSVTVSGTGATRWLGGRLAWIGGQVVAGVLFIPLRLPLIFPLVLLLLFPQWLAMVWVDDHIINGWTRRAWPWLIVVMLLVAGSA